MRFHLKSFKSMIHTSRKGILLFIFLSFSGSLSHFAHAQCGPASSLGTGLWSSPSTWDSGSVPISCNSVTINSGHVVTVDTLNATASTTTINGTLSFSRVVSSSLTLVGGDISVNGGGTLDMGTEAEPIPGGVNATLVLALGSKAGQYGLIVNGSFFVRGATKSPFGVSLTNVIAGVDTSLQISGSDASGWNIGDEITIGPTQGNGTDSTERRTITNITGTDPKTISWNVPLTYTHYSTGTIMVGNLTRNVLVRSAGTNINGNSSYISIYSTSFYLKYGEFAYLGATPSAPFYGIYCQGSTVNPVGPISNSAIHDGHMGVYIGSGHVTIDSNLLYGNNLGIGLSYLSSYNIITRNQIHSNSSWGIDIYQGGNNTITSNSVYSNGDGINLYYADVNSLTSNNVYSNGSGISVRGLSDFNSIRLNHVYSNATTGIYIEGGYNNLQNNNSYLNSGVGIYVAGYKSVLELNNSYSNGLAGISITAGLNTLLSNTAYSNLGNGIELKNNCLLNRLELNESRSNLGSGIYISGSSNTVISNKSYSNNQNGISLWNSAGNFLQFNNAYLNVGDGISLDNSIDNVVLSNNSYSNSGMGLYLNNPPAHTMVLEGNLGYDGAGDSRPNGKAQVGFGVSGKGGLTLKRARVNSQKDIDSSGLNEPGKYIISFSQNFDTGTMRLWGDYLVRDSTLTVDYLNQLYASTSSTPTVVSGLNSFTIKDVVTDDQNTLTELITVSYGATNSWDVKGSSSGILGQIPCPPSWTCTFSHPKLRFTLKTSNGSYSSDSVAFVTVGASQDQNVMKRVLLGGAGPGFNQGRSKLTIDPSGGFKLLGTVLYPSIMDRLDSSSTYYTFVDSGAFTLAYSTITNFDENGVQLSGSASLSMSSSTFDFAGQGNSPVSSYITAKDLKSAATFYGLIFNNSRPNTTLYNIKVQGVDADLNWTMQNWGGERGGEAYDDDLNNRIQWAMPSPAVVSPTFLGVFASSIAVQWGINGDGQGVTYRVQISTISGYSVVATSLTTNTSATFTSLLPNTTYYLSVRAEIGGVVSEYTNLGSRSTLTAPVLGAQITGMSSKTITLHWDPFPMSPPAVSSETAEGYRLEVSTMSDFLPVWDFKFISDLSISTWTFANLSIGTTYYLRMGSLNWEGVPNFAVLDPVFLNPGGGDTIPPADTLDLSTAPVYLRDDQAQISWTAPGDDGDVGTAASYEIRHSSVQAITPGNFGQADVWRTSRPVSGPAGTPESEIITGLTVGTNYTFALKTRDAAGNVSRMSNVVSYVAGQDLRGGVIEYAPVANSVGVDVTTSVTVRFTMGIDTTSLNNGFSVRAVLDKDGNSLDQVIPGSIMFSSATKRLSFSPTSSLSFNYTYEVRVTTDVKDTGNRPIFDGATWRFTTLFDHAVSNTIVSPTEIKLSIPAGAFSGSGYILISTTVQNVMVQSANRNLLSRDSFMSPIKTFTVEAWSNSGSKMQPAVMLTAVVPFDDINRDGFVDGINTRIRKKTLSLWWLDEPSQSWTRIPGGSVNSLTNTVTSSLPHFSTFALIGAQDTSLQDSYAFPVPYVPSQQTTRVITFKNLSSKATIRIYTVSGSLVNTIEETDGDGQTTWDVKNASGENVASGVYLYLITNDKEKTKGKLIVVR
ncbi:MAG: right-handed parallel beta-helix repeat-containing protein [Elusimicrobia bacterium]|nr:right-handed parallel beta-helix repeat-containing protein [Elusimicrobiota bacterium]